MAKEEDRSEYAKAGFCKRLFFLYINPLINLSNLRFKEGSSLKEDDLFEVRKDMKSKEIIAKFIKIYAETRSLWIAGRKVVGKIGFWMLFFYTTHNLLQYAGPIFMKLILEWMEDDDAEDWEGYALVGGMLFCLMLRVTFQQHGYHVANIGQVRMMGSLYGSLYEKALRISTPAKLSCETGRILTLYSSDATSCAFMVQAINWFYTLPINMTVCLILIYLEIGWVAIIGLAVALLGGVFQKYIMGKWSEYRRKKLKYTDQRTKYINEYIDGIRILKYYGWEYFALKNIGTARDQEVQLMFKSQLLRSFTDLTFTIIPVVMIASTLGTYVAMGGELTVPKTYSVIILFRMIAIPLGIMAMVLQFAVRAKISAQRLNCFLSSDDKKDDAVKEREDLAAGDIIIKDGFFAWETQELANQVEEFKMVTERTYSGKKSKEKAKSKEKEARKGVSNTPTAEADKNIGHVRRATEEKAIIENMSIEDEEPPQKCCTILKDININIKRGEMIAIVGAVGSGKSTLAQAILGEVVRESGSVVLSGNIRYLPQTPWIRNDTVKGNILLGSGDQAFDDAKYRRVLANCELERDLETFDNKDLTEIGSKGINLSGGQKQRVSIARALYSGADIYIIDDCLSALDAQVSHSVFQNVILGGMDGSTRIFITHAIHLLNKQPKVHRIIVLKDGEIVESGDYETLIAQQGEFTRLSQIESEKLEKEAIVNESESEGEILINDNKVDSESEGEIRKEELNAESEGVGQEVNPGLFADAEQTDQIFGEGDPLLVEVSFRSRKQSLEDAEKGAEEYSPERARGKSIPKRSRGESIPRRGRGDSVAPKKSRAESVEKELRKKEEDKLKGKLIVEEKVERGKVKCDNYWKIIKFGGACTAIFTVFMYAISSGLRIISQWWLGIWAVDEYNKGALWYFQIYCYIGLAMGLFALIRGTMLAFFLRNLSKSCQMRLMETLLKSPLSWFDITPTGRIINRAIKDQMTIDEEIPFILAQTIANTLFVLASLLLICVVTPYFALVMVVLIILYMYWYSNVIQYGRDTRRLESKSKSPIFSLFEETLEGLSTIRACKLTPVFMKKMETQLDSTHSSFFANATGVRWMNLRLELVGTITIASAALFAVIAKDDIDSNMAGLSMVNALVISTSLGWMLTNIGNLEVKMSSMERMMEYIDDNPQEKPFKYDKPRVTPEWPEKGRIEVNKLFLKYQKGLPTVLKGISFVCEPGERVGVVGRTGSGKTTLTLGLLRILEPYMPKPEDADYEDTQRLGKSEKEPDIIIDGVNVSDIGLHELRSQIAMIPQDPVLFSGTVQSNLDPFGALSFKAKIDALQLTSLLSQLWKKLSEEKKNKEKRKEEAGKNEIAINLDDKIYDLENLDKNLTEEELKEILEYKVGEGGSNFSLGERQLICLARAISRKPRVLLMDEATASIDEATDNKIQEMLRTQFANVTTLTIAHRLKTIIEYDKILVLQDGTVFNFDTPINLIEQKDAIFYKLITENGEEFLKEMTALASKKQARLNQN